MANTKKKKKNNKSKNGLAIVIVLVLVLAVAAVIYVAYKRGDFNKDETNTTVVIETTAPDSDTENTVEVVTDSSQDTADVTSETTTEPASAETSASAPIKVDHKVSESNGDTASGQKASLYADLPVFSSTENEDNVAKLNEYLKAEYDGFKDKYAQSLGATSDDTDAAQISDTTASSQPCDFRITYDVYQSDSGIVSVLLKKSEKDTVTYKAVNYDLNNGKQFDLNSVLNSDGGVDAIKAEIYDRIKKSPDQYSVVDEAAYNSAFNEANFLSTPNGVVIFFQPGTIASKDKDIVRFEFTFSELINFITF